MSDNGSDYRATIAEMRAQLVAGVKANMALRRNGRLGCRDNVRKCIRRIRALDAVVDDAWRYRELCK